MTKEIRSSRGRPRDLQARLSILDAAYALVATHGYYAVTTAQIAAQAGAGKQTIYRWWPTKGLLVLDALEHWFQRLRGQTEGGSFSATLVTMCRGATLTGPVLRALLAESQGDPVLHQRLKLQVIEPRGAELRLSLGDRRARDRDAIVEVVSGLFWQRLLLSEPLDAAFVRRVIQLVRRIR